MNALEMYLKSILGILEKDEDDRSEEEKAKLDKASAALDGLTEDTSEDEESGKKKDDDEEEDPLAVEGATPVDEDDLKEILADLIDEAKEDGDESPLLDVLEDLISELGG